MFIPLSLVEELNQTSTIIRHFFFFHVYFKYCQPSSSIPIAIAKSNGIIYLLMLLVCILLKSLLRDYSIRFQFASSFLALSPLAFQTTWPFPPRAPHPQNSSLLQHHPFLWCCNRCCYSIWCFLCLDIHDLVKFFEVGLHFQFLSVHRFCYFIPSIVVWRSSYWVSMKPNRYDTLLAS